VASTGAGGQAAESISETDAETAGRQRREQRTGERLRPYRAVLASRARAQRSYRTSFALDLGSSGLVGLVELAEVWVLFRNVTALGGMRFNQILLVFGLADLSFSLADLSFGHLDTLPDFLRAGTLDAFYLRPQPILLQLITSDVSLRRLARAGVGAAALGVGLATAGVSWHPATAALLPLALVSGYATFAALFVWAAGLQFFLLDGAEMTNAFVYGGRYAATQPASVWSRPLKLVFGFFFPMAFTAYLPTVTLLGLPGPDWLPAWLGWCAPAAAVWAWLMASLFWRWGVRHYQGGGG
jgi:ABC-2 type transport system permease protein